MSVGGVQLTEVLSYAQKVLQETPENLKQFDQVLQQMEQQKGKVPEGTQQSGAVEGAGAKSITLDAKVGTDLKVDELSTEKARQAQTPEGLRVLTTELESDHRQLNDLVKQLQGNRTYSPQELLSIQGKMHDLTLNIEVTTKVVSEAVSGIKQLLQQQI